MNEFNKEVISVFGNKLRVRVCGVCIKADEILLIKHKSLGNKNIFWAPPGGGIQFGESAEEALVREFKEETGLDIEVLQFLFVHEFLEVPLHSVELFFEIKITGGELIKGHDPEMSSNKQIITEVRYISFKEIEGMDRDRLHNMFNLSKKPSEILNLKGYYLDHRKQANS
jgi:8-oxo-dGTP diphosphatase